MSDFTGTKGAFFHNGRLLVFLRDNKPGLPFANMWDFPGGGREGDENAFECLAREANEEFGLVITEDQIKWQREVESMSDPEKKSQFFVIELNDKQVANITFGDEGQHWRFMDVREFMDREDAVPKLKSRLQSYLDTLE
jgi:8-oxo-dGTP diphosphatase